MRSCLLQYRVTPLLAVLTLVFSAGCGQPTAPTADLLSETFTGTIAVLGSDSKPFTVVYTQGLSEAAVTVTALNSVATGAAVTTTIGIGFGRPSATDGSCLRDPAYSTSAATLNQTLNAGAVFRPDTYCVQIFDAGTLTEPVTFSYTVQHF